MRNVVLRKGMGTRVFGGKTYYYMGTVNPIIAKSVALQLANKGIRSRVTQNNLLWVDNPRVHLKSNPVKGQLRATVPVVSYIYRGYEIVLDKKSGLYHTQYGKFDSMARAVRDIDFHFRGEAKPIPLPPKFRNPRGQAGAYFTGNPTKTHLRKRLTRFPDPTIVSKRCQDEMWKKGMIV